MAADLETDLGDAEISAAQQRHRPLDPPRHQVSIRRLSVGQAELPAQMPRRHVHIAREGLDIQRFRVLAIDPVADAPQPREITETLLGGG